MLLRKGGDSLKKWCLALGLAFFLFGCSNDDAKTGERKEPNLENEQTGEEAQAEPQNEEEQEENEEAESWIAKFEEAPAAPLTETEIVNQVKGPFANAELFKETQGYEELFDSFGEIPEEATNEELDKVFNYALSQVAVDFPSPQEIIDSWTIDLFGDPELEDKRYHFKNHYNIEIILDSSGSMANLMSEKTRMDVAKEAILAFLEDAPKDANVALRVYGHKGTGDDSDKELSCSSSELVYDFGSYEKSKFQNALTTFQPAGWTPLAQSLRDAENDMEEFSGEEHTNMIYVVSDGVETCDGNPVEAAKSFAESNIQPIINIIGFDVDGEGQMQLKKMAEQANGTYSSADNAEQLTEEFNKAKSALEKWEQWMTSANRDARSDELKRSRETFDYNSRYINNLFQQNKNLTALLRELKDNSQLTWEQWSYLDNKRGELYDVIDDTRIEIKEDLKDLNTKTLEETKKQIQEKYNQNTN